MPRVTLTDRFCSGAKALAGKRIEFFDNKTTGLALRVATSGHKTWYFNFTDPRRSKRGALVLGSYPATSLASARTKALEAQGMVQEGRDPRMIKPQASVTLGEILEAYLARHVWVHLKTASKIEERLRRDVFPVIGDIAAADLSKRDISRALDRITARGSRVMAARVFEDLRAALRWAVAVGEIDHNVMAGMRKPESGKARERTLSDAEIATLWPQMAEAFPRAPQMEAILKLCLLTGQRIGEIVGMRADELDLTGGLWTIPGTRTKNGHTHTVPLVAEAVRIIRGELGEGAVFVFPCNGGSLDPHAVARNLSRAFNAGRMPVAHFTAHDCRRTVLSGLARLGVLPVVIAEVANHRSVRNATVTFASYVTHDYGTEKAEALDRWANHIVPV